MNNIKSILLRCMRRARARLRAGEIDLVELTAYKDRYQRLMRRYEWLKKLDRLRQVRARQLGSLAVLQEAIETGATITAFDTEFTMNGPVEQLGVATWTGGRFVVDTYVLASRADRYAKARCPIGRNHVVRDRDEMIDAAQAAHALADVSVFHTKYVEIDKLGLDPTITPCIDVASLAMLIDPVRRLGLKTLCEHFRVPLISHHNAGNDAVATLKVALAMASALEQVDPRKLMTEDEAELHALMMAPARWELPDPDRFDALSGADHAAEEHRRSTLAQAA